jgi:hypothetical protein
MFIAYFFCQLLSILHSICVSPILTGVVNQVLPANGYSTTSIGIQYTNENSRYIPVTGNTNENDRYIPETGNTNGNDHYILIIGSHFIFVPWCSFSLIIGKISVKLFLSKLKLFLMK